MPSASTDRIDGISTSVAVKAPVRVATTAALTLSGLQTVNGVALAADDRVLVKDQADATENGIYVAAASAWQRAKDFDGNRDAVKGTQVYATDGTAVVYRCTADDPVVIGESEIAFQADQVQFGTVEDADNYLIVQGSDTTPYYASVTHGAVLLEADGAATSARLDYRTKGRGAYGNAGHAFYVDDELLMRLEPTGITGTLDRHVHIEPGSTATSQFPSIRSMANDGYIGPDGSGTNNNVTASDINFGILSCGRGYVGFHTRGGNRDTAVGGGAGTGGGTDVLQCMVADTPAASGWAEIRGGTASANVRIGASSGFNTNQGLTLFTQNAGAIDFVTDAATYSDSGSTDRRQLQITHTATAVNYWTMTGATTGNSPNIQVAGSDSVVGMILGAKGGGSISLNTRSNAPQLIVVDAPSSVNNWYVKGSATGTAMEIGAYPVGDSNIDLSLVPRGTGTVNAPSVNATGSNLPANGIYLSAANTPAISARSLKALEITNPASAVNYISMSGATTGGLPNIGAWGSDTNVNLSLYTKGTGSFYLYTNFSVLQAVVAHAASAANYIQLGGSAAGGPITISALGSDTNIDLSLAPKGTGVVRFGSWTSNADAAVNGYITVRDSSGNTRKLATIA